MCPTHPVENVSVNDVFDYLKILRMIDPYLKLRLPSSEEWEYSARAMSKELFWFSSKYEEVG